MMNSFRSASKNTMFGQWLDATMRPAAAASEARDAAQSRQPPQLPLHDLAQYLAEEKIGNVTLERSPGSVR